jgi:hypothetical protein
MARANAVFGFLTLVRQIGLLGLGRHQRRRIVDSSDASFFASGEVASIALMRTMVRLRRFSSEPSFAARSASDGSQPSSRRSVLAGSLELATLPAHARGHASLRSASIIAPRMRRSANVLEFDAARLVEAVRGVDQADHPVLDEIADVNGVRHRRRNTTGELLHEGDAGDNARIL